jgi:hypothetical protein
MADVLFVVLAVVYAVVAIMVDRWFTISCLGFKSETPQGFLEYPRRYHGTRKLLFVAATVTLFFVHIVPWYVGAAVLAAVWFSAFWIGRNLGFADFRRIHREMIEDDASLKVNDPVEYSERYGKEDPLVRRAELEKGAHISNQELIERVQRRLKYGI